MKRTKPKFKAGNKVRFSFRTGTGSHRHGNGIVKELYGLTNFGYWYGVETAQRFKGLYESELRPLTAREADRK
jgi:hypothetical protein